MSTLVECPVCTKKVPEAFLSFHLDSPSCKPAPDAGSSSSGSKGVALKRKATEEVIISDEESEDESRSAVKPPSKKGKEKAPAPQVQSAPPQAKKAKLSDILQAAKPLAERMRPETLDEFVGQESVLGPGTVLRGLIESDKVGSCILWGPPGVGKTTIARVIAKLTKSSFVEMSATNAATADIRKVFERAENELRLTGRKTLLFLDEIQRFNKAMQDLFLPYVEAGTINLISSTTENPSFRCNRALLSRCRVFVLEKLSPANILVLLKRALERTEEAGSSSQVREALTDDLLEYLAAAADGDGRVALSSLELALAAVKSGTKMTTAQLKEQLRKAHLQYDRSGDLHYDTISALHKSVRGSDANAALYWLARMLEGGDDPLYVARRMIRMASEDIGLANPDALPQAVATYQAVQLLGMPECDVVLAQCCVMLAESPKSIRVYEGYNKAKALVKTEQNYPVPLHIRNAPTTLMKQLDYGKEYLYNPSFAHPVYQTYLPPELGSAKFLGAEGEGRKVDEGLLRQWEVKVQGGRKWEGRQGPAN